MKIPKILSDIYWSVDSKKYFFLIAAFSILLNWAGHTFVYENSYKFLYFDMLGTFVAAMVLGSAWGMLVALSTAILLSNITSPHFIYLAVVNITGAFYWGFLSESGNLEILKTANYSLKTNLKTNLMSAVKFILFAGIGGGLLTALFSSVVRSFIFRDFSFDRPYSIYFAQLFREVFGVIDTGRLGLFTNYVAETFIEIPDKVLTAFFGIAICLTIFKFNIKTLTLAYHEKIEEKKLTWHSIMLKNFGGTEILIFLVLAITYLFKIKAISLKIFTGVIENISIYSLRDYVFLEMIMLPLAVIAVFIVLKIFFQEDEDSAFAGIDPNIKDNFYIKNMDVGIKYFLADVFCFSAALAVIYMYILVTITGVTPVRYYKTFSSGKASPETLVWLFIMLIIFILIDRRNNRVTETLTLSDELIKKQTVEQISESFDAQRQRLQVLELSWSDNTVAFLRSARHDLVNQLEKSKTGMDELLVEIYDNVVKPYSNSILESQKAMRSYVEEITSGRLGEYSLEEIMETITNIIDALKQKTSSYINFEYEHMSDTDKKYCRINKLFFTAFNNILDNSVYALQKKVLIPDFKAVLGIKFSVADGRLCVAVYDNAGGLSKDKLSKIYKISIESSKGNRMGEGTMITKNFIKILDGYVTARNIRIAGENGLETEIHIPVYAITHGK
ncbi:MAG: hypothetical protein LBL00_01355 [Endomicrobium sp.]|jgi:hypothetical protein|nr:hypothetical protein [Endomicrobium sp.]